MFIGWWSYSPWSTCIHKCHSMYHGDAPPTWLSFHSCNYGMFIGWCSYSPWSTCIHKCHSMYHGAAPAVIVTQSHRWHMPWWCSVNVYASIPTRLSQALSVKSMSQCWSCVCITIVRWQLCHIVHWVHLATHFAVVTGHWWEVCYPIWQWRACRKQNLSG
jgi:hypothetical protein